MNPKILVVDDEIDVCEVMSCYLGKKGFFVIAATSGQEAISKLVEEKPDLILLDISMPDMNGLECLRQIRKLDKNVLVVMSSGVTDEDIAKQALELGAVDYITKPLDVETIHTAILAYLFQNNRILSEREIRSQMHISKDENNREEKRKEPRAGVIFIDYCLGKAHSPKISTFAKNISGCGICILLLEDVKINTTLSVTIHLLDRENPIEVKGRVMWTKASNFLRLKDTNHFEAGLEYIDIGDADQARIVAYVIRSSQHKALSLKI